MVGCETSLGKELKSDKEYTGQAKASSILSSPWPYGSLLYLLYLLHHETWYSKVL